MRKPTLWRLFHSDSTRPIQLAEVLHVHLAHAPLTAVLAQIGDKQRIYLALDGCSGCLEGRCLPGCRADLLRRALCAAEIGELSLVPEGLAARPYSHAVLALPGREAQPLDGALLQSWSDARMVLHWRSWRGTSLVATALLLASQECDPAAALRAYGWKSFPLPGALLRRADQPIPPALPLGKRWQGSPYLPQPVTEPAIAPFVASIDRAPSEIDAMLAGWLRAAIDQPGQALRETEEVHSDSMLSVSTHTERTNRWPAGPGGMPPEVLGQLIPQIFAEPTFRSTRKGQSGISKGRLAGLRHPYLGESNARVLIVWLDRAGLLASPEDGQSAWRAPRIFVTDDLDAIAAKLSATPLPTLEDVRSAYGGEQ